MLCSLAEFPSLRTPECGSCPPIRPLSRPQGQRNREAPLSRPLVPTKFLVMGVLDAGGKSQIWGVFSAPAASCSDKTHSCCRTSPPRLGLRAFAQAGPLLAICFQPLPPGEMQHKCAGTPTVMPSLTPLLCPPEAHSSLQCLRLAFTHCPITIFQSRSPLHMLGCKLLKGSGCV